MRTPKVGSKAWLEQVQEENEGELLLMDGYNDCIVGICTRIGSDPAIIYSRKKVIAKLVKQGMSVEEAEEFHEFNQAGAWVGKNTPYFLESQ